MKRAALILAVLMLFSLAACGTGEQNALSPTAAPTEAVTEAPTEVPTEAPTEEPTAVPTASPVPETPDFSGLIPQTGRLCEGPIFPEPGKYLVLSAGGGLFLVYDNMGELIKTFNAVEDEYAFGSPGIYGEDGICENVRISTGEDIGAFRHFGDLVFTCSWVEEDSWNCYVNKVFDADFNELFSFEDEPSLGRIGREGGVLHVGDDILILDRDSDGGCTIRVFGADGTNKGELDPALFPRQIMGVLGGKYLICGSAQEESDPYYFWEEHKLSVWDLKGNLLMDNVHAETYSQFTVDSEGGWGILLAADYVEDADGNWYNSELERVDAVPEGADRDPFYARYGSLEIEGCRAITWSMSPFCGIKDPEGNWLFRIYNPKYASDNDPEFYWY